MGRQDNRPRIPLHERLRLDKDDETLVWGLMETADPRDERCSGAPCCGQHVVDQPNCRIRNQHTLIVKCRQCQIRLLYVPVRGSTGDSRTATPLTQTVADAAKDPTRGKAMAQAKNQANAKAKAKARVRHTDGPSWGTSSSTPRRAS